MRHLEEGEIHAWLDGALSGDEQARIERHARECAECSVAVAEARGMIAGAARIISALDVVPGGVIPKQTPARRAPAPASLWRSLRLTPVRAGLAASLMIAAASVFAVRHDVSKNSVLAPRTEVVVAPPAASEAAPSPPPSKVSQAQVPSDVAPPPPPPPPTPKPAPPRRREPALGDTKAMVAEADSAKAKSTAPVPAVAAVADAGVAAAQLQVDSVRAKPAASADAAAGRGAFEMRRASTMNDRLQLQEVVVTSSASPPASFVGCYQIGSDAVNSLSPLPARFALERTSDSAGDRNTVRAIGPDGRDTLLVGATWTALRPTMVNVTWTAGDRYRALLISRTDDRITALVPGLSQRVAINKVACKP